MEEVIVTGEIIEIEICGMEGTVAIEAMVVTEREIVIMAVMIGETESTAIEMQEEVQGNMATATEIEIIVLEEVVDILVKGEVIEIRETKEDIVAEMTETIETQEEEETDERISTMGREESAFAHTAERELLTDNQQEEKNLTNSILMP